MDLNDTRSNTVRSRRSIFLIAITSFALSFSALGMAPVSASQTIVNDPTLNKDSGEKQNYLVQSLIVEYEPKTAPLDSEGDITGQEFSDIALEMGDYIAPRTYTLELSEPITATDAGELTEDLAKSPEIKFAEPNFPISLMEEGISTSAGTSQSTVNNPGLWGLDRIDQRSLPLDQTYTYDQTGLGVNAYVIDTGIYPHNEFAGRLLPGFTAINDGNGTSDCNGHGTHVAGSLGGTTFGVAKEVSLIPVRVFPCTGDAYLDDVIAGVNWVKEHHQPGELSVANMSLGGPLSNLLDQAVKSLIADGVHVIVASGNGGDDRIGDDACTQTPASTLGTITVNSMNREDSRSIFSNWGKCTDIYAPGENIISAGITDADSTAVASGTSMATPIVSGAMAKVLQSNPKYTQSQATAQLLEDATPFSSGIAGDASRILYSPSALGEIAIVEASRIAAEQAAAAEAARVAAAKKAAADKLAADRIAASLPVVRKSLKVKALKKKRLSVSVSAPAGSTTVIQRKVGKKWKTVTVQQKVGKKWKKTRVTKTRSSSIIKVSRAGTYRVQIKIPTGTITTKSYRVR